MGKRNLEDTLYREWVPAGKLVKSVVGFVFSLLAFVLIVIVVFETSLTLVMAVVMLIPLAFVGAMFWIYRGLEIKVNKRELQVNYGFNRKRVSFSEVDSCKPTKVSFWRYGGVGVRWGFDGSWAYTTSLGEAIRLKLRRGRPFVFSTHNPNKICKLIDACN
jgi:heme/copper-type cytochrome/quinol oxidase subunit 4